eukprot:752637-Hanusia_phi.AAC.1
MCWYLEGRNCKPSRHPPLSIFRRFPDSLFPPPLGTLLPSLLPYFLPLEPSSPTSTTRLNLKLCPSRCRSHYSLPLFMVSSPSSSSSSPQPLLPFLYYFSVVTSSDPPPPQRAAMTPLPTMQEKKLEKKADRKRKTLTTTTPSSPTDPPREFERDAMKDRGILKGSKDPHPWQKEPPPDGLNRQRGWWQLGYIQERPASLGMGYWIALGIQVGVQIPGMFGERGGRLGFGWIGARMRGMIWGEGAEGDEFGDEGGNGSASFRAMKP